MYIIVQAGLNETFGFALQGFLDEQFTQLQQLQDESNPYFVKEVASLFFEESSKLLDTLLNIMYIYLFFELASLIFGVGNEILFVR